MHTETHHIPPFPCTTTTHHHHAGLFEIALASRCVLRRAIFVFMWDPKSRKLGVAKIGKELVGPDNPPVLLLLTGYHFDLLVHKKDVQVTDGQDIVTYVDGAGVSSVKGSLLHSGAF